MSRPGQLPRTALVSLLAGLALLGLGVALLLGGDDTDRRAPLQRCPRALAGAARSTPAGGNGPAAVQVRVNQVGYPTGCHKLALVMTAAPLADPHFVVRDAASGAIVLTGSAQAARGAWSSAWPHIYPVDFSRLRTPGRYVLRVGGADSPAFRIGSARALYGPLVEAAVRFFEAQRDGPQVISGRLRRQPSHLTDASATVYQRPRYSGSRLARPLRPTGVRTNAAGGWFDAGDYLKFVETASFSDILMLFTLRDHGGSLTSRSALENEARFGIDWLARMWDRRNRVLYYQVGIGDGDGGSVLGDHDLWRLPQIDDQRNERPGAPAFFVKYRPVFAANAPGRPISPNLAGRVAAAFALCAQVFHSSRPHLARRCLDDARAVYVQADLAPRGPLLAASPAAYYADPEWHDDMELGAIELYLATRDLGIPAGGRFAASRLVAQAGSFANAYMSSPTDGQDSLNLYDVSALAHFDLADVLRRDAAIRRLSRLRPRGPLDVPTDIGALRSDYADQLALAARLAARDPFRLADTATNLDTVPHALGYAIQARLYDAIIGKPIYEVFAQTELDWVLGKNAWGASFVIGAGSAYPHCPAHQVANLSGSLDGSPPILAGATVVGPTAPDAVRQLGAPDGYRPCPPAGHAASSPFDSPSMAYTDNVASFATAEPGDDFTALSLLAFAQAADAE